MRKILLASLISLLCFSTAFAAEYKIDPDHSRATFKVRHLGISWVPGIFSKVEGTFSFDDKDIKASKAEAKIEVSSIDTQNKKRDDHLKSDDFFSASKFPFITYTSKSIKDISGNKFIVVGDLTIRGVTKPIELNAEFTGAVKDPWGNDRAAFQAESKLNRKEFGLQWNQLLETGALVVGEEILISIEVEGIKVK